MNFIRTVLAVLVVGAVIWVKLASIPSTAPSTPGATPSPAATTTAAEATTTTTSNAIPQKALNVLQIVRSTGQPPDGYVGGRVFDNREGHLPADGSYREFDVDPHNGQRNAERIIVEWNTKKAWYTGDHYQTFTPLP